MNLKEARHELAKKGWIIYERKESDDYDGYFLVNNFRIIISIKIKKLVDAESLLANFFVFDQSFSDVMSHVRGDGIRAFALNSYPKTWRGTETKISHDTVATLSEVAIAWAKQLSLDKCLYEYSQIPTNAIGIFPLRHLAALAMLSDIDKLQFYQDSFQKGDHLGFVPYITIDYIERALSKAYEYKNITNKN